MMEMDDKMKEEMKEKLKRMGFDEKLMENEHAMWAGKKLMFSIGKLKWVLEESGVKAEEAKEGSYAI
jgi:hypothetical protein